MTQKFDPRQPTVDLGRRRISALTALALLGGATITIGCGGGSSGGSSNPNSPNPTPTPTPPLGTGSVSANHPAPHLAVITASQLSAGGGLILDISNGLHSHLVTLTGAQVTQIAGGTRVSVASTTDPHSDGSDPHSHMVTFN